MTSTLCIIAKLQVKNVFPARFGHHRHDVFFLSSLPVSSFSCGGRVGVAASSSGVSRFSCAAAAAAAAADVLFSEEEEGAAGDSDDDDEAAAFFLFFLALSILCDVCGRGNCFVIKKNREAFVKHDFFFFTCGRKAVVVAVVFVGGGLLFI